MSRESIFNVLKKTLLVCSMLIRYGMAGIIALIFFVPALALACLPEKYRYNNRLLFWLLDKTYKGVSTALMIPITITGQQHVPQQPALFVANHESALDIPLLGSILDGHPHLWYVLAYYANTPVLSFFVRRLSMFIDPSLPSSAAQSLIKGIRIAQKWRLHILIFPEGGRFIDGHVHPFYQGFSLIAKKTSYPVIPVFLHNTGRVYPPGSFIAHPYPLSIHIGTAFHFKSDDTLESFTARVYQWFAHQEKEHASKA